MKVLIANEYKTLQRVIYNLMKTKYDDTLDVDFADNAEEAVDKIEDNKYDLIICEDEMDSSAISNTIAMRWVLDLVKVPILYVAPRSREGKSMAVGFNDTIYKPFNANTLKSHIDEVMAQ